MLETKHLVWLGAQRNTLEICQACNETPRVAASSAQCFRDSHACNKTSRVDVSAAQRSAVQCSTFEIIVIATNTSCATLRFASLAA